MLNQPTKDEISLDELMEDLAITGSDAAKAAVVEIRARSELNKKKPIFLQEMTEEMIIPKPLIMTPFFPLSGHRLDICRHWSR